MKLTFKGSPILKHLTFEHIAQQFFHWCGSNGFLKINLFNGARWRCLQGGESQEKPGVPGGHPVLVAEAGGGVDPPRHVHHPTRVDMVLQHC